uniref:Uncharacterized protein n=1 Tax=Arundo donax TaxID=35708 RepID=A0A0A9C8A4_ARUDO
MGARAPATAT